jgi:hypothetical protein
MLNEERNLTKNFKASNMAWKERSLGKESLGEKRGKQHR